MAQRTPLSSGLFAYAVAEITPKKLKENLLSIATVGALIGSAQRYQEPPCLERWWLFELYFDHRGGWVHCKETRSAVVEIPSTIEDLEIAIENDFNIASGKVVKGAKSMLSKAEKFSKKVHEMLDEELKELFEEA